MPSRATALPPEERRSAIIDAVLPLLLARGAGVTSREIAEAAGVAEGTIFAVFHDKNALVQAALRAAFDPEPTERAIHAIDRALSLEEQLVAAVDIIQRRHANIWRLVSSVGDISALPERPRHFAALVDLLRPHASRLRVGPVVAAQHLRALTLAASHPVLCAGEPLTPREIAKLLLDGIRAHPRARQEQEQEPVR